MTTPKIGWNVDWADTNSNQIGGTNHVLGRFTEIETLRTAGDAVPINKWIAAVEHLRDHMLASGPEVFMDGPDGAMLVALVAALGGNVSSAPAAIPAAPFNLPTINERTLIVADVANEKIGIPQWVNVDTIAWTIAGSGIITIANDTTDTVELTGVAAGTETVTCTVTAVDGSISTSVFDVIVPA